MKDESVVREDSGVAPGDRVLVAVKSSDNTDETATEKGELVADYQNDMTEADAELGRSWARPKRFAVALDDGRLVFADTVESCPPS
ncbi:hypothetical protein SAMN05444695_11637 [Rhodococcus triatomae]|uniref:Uncharacterized protein n=2 Tax=Rhodococcus triatomae TaxID=300028 RepID=A0A1G8QWT5_9NOCA|nr:hypothetical protein [Rhodococcus triatomae]SDJ09168.1 hypothetical protein SAMN05444695_11637 [Rhodococcus triatomae]